MGDGSRTDAAHTLEGVLGEMLDLLIAADPEAINAVDVKRWTPLQTTAEFASLSLTQRLLDNGAEVDVGDLNGWTALHWAAHGEFKETPDVINALLEAGASLAKLTTPKGKNGQALTAHQVALSPAAMAALQGQPYHGLACSFDEQKRMEKEAGMR